jgi:N-acetylmuramoyl-L-alanine amidase
VLDAGHGGEETGAKGLNGVAEKHLCLSWTLTLQQQLKQLGFKHVLLTRNNDTFMSLQERQQVSQQHHADITLSLHFNALPDGRNPWEAFGASSYYYYPHARALAIHLQQAMTTQGKRNDYGLFYDSLAMTRMTHCQAVLLELGFLIHPFEFEELLLPETKQRLLTALATGLLTYTQGLTQGLTGEATPT